MYLTSVEKMWRYLHDDPSLVSEYFFVTNPYSYTSRFTDMISSNPEALPQLKSRMKIEKAASSIFGLLLREGYGFTEYRIVKMMRQESFREVLKNNFPELLQNEVGPILRRK